MRSTFASRPDEAELEGYVLGLLPAEQAERLDEESIADDEIAHRLRTIETDLVDSYVRGQLTGLALERFESHYLASPRRREAVRLAAGFVRAVDRSAAAAESMAPPAPTAAPMTLKWFVPVAAVLTLAVGGSMLFESTRTRRQDAAPSIASVPVERGQAASTPERELAVVLQPPTRAVAAPPTLTLHADVTTVSFTLRLEAQDFERCRVELKDAVTNRILWRSDWIPVASSGEPSVSVRVAAALLNAQRYSLDVAGQDTRGREDVIGSYPIRIERP